MKYFGLLVMCMVLTVTSYGQSLDQEKLNNYFDALVNAEKMMGAVMMVQDGDILYQYAFGYADMESEIKNVIDTEFRIGSISKMFTAVLILRAMENGLLDLDATIDAYFPEVENAAQISIRHLLQHRSGIRSFTEGGQYLTWYTTPKTRSELYDILVNQGSEFTPNARANYSNSNYVLLTWLLEDIYGKDYSELLQEQITDPLGLKSTRIGGKIDSSAKQAKSYVMHVDWTLSEETDMSVPLGAGAIISNMKDLTIFIHALFDGQLIQSSSLENMMTTQDNFGLGMLKIPFQEYVSYGHTGGIDGFRSVLSYFPEEKLAVAFASNGADYDTNLAPVAMLSAYFGQDFSIPEFNQENLPESELERLLGDYASEIFPLEISLSLEGGKLIGRATGQPSFPLTYEGDYLFSFSPASLTLQFSPDSDTMILKQGGMTFEFKKK